MAEKRKTKNITFTTNWRRSSFLQLWKILACVSFAGQVWRQQSGTMWRDTSLRVTKATMLTTHREAHHGQKKPMSWKTHSQLQCQVTHQLQYTGEQHAMLVFPLTNKQTPDVVSGNIAVPWQSWRKILKNCVQFKSVFMTCNSYNFIKNAADLVISSKCDKIYFKICQLIFL